jgi:hypothetical protein
MALMSIAEMRAFDKGQLASAVDYPDPVLTAEAVAVKEWLELACGCNFEPTAHTEAHDGDGSDYLVLRWPLVTEVTAISIDGVAVAAPYLNASDYSAGLALDYERGLVTSRSFTFTAGWSNVEISYTAGYASTPAMIKRACLRIAVSELPASNAPWTADGYTEGETSYSFSRGDGYRDAWSADPEVMRAIRLYTRRLPGVA